MGVESKVTPEAGGAGAGGDSAEKGPAEVSAHGRTQRSKQTLRDVAVTSDTVPVAATGIAPVKVRGGKVCHRGDESAFDAPRALVLSRHCMAAYLAPDDTGAMHREPPEWMLPSMEEQVTEPSTEDGAERKDGPPDEPSLRTALRNGLGLGPPIKLLEWVDHAQSDTQMYFAEAQAPGHAGPELLVVFRGTTSMKDWLNDLAVAKTYFEPADDTYEDIIGCGSYCAQVACCGWQRPLVHMGNYRAYMAVREHIQRHVRWDRPGGIGRLTICGHSLGAALATLALADAVAMLGPSQIVKSGCPVELFTIGSPRVGTAGFLAYVAALVQPLVSANLFRNARCVNDVDIVPRVPPIALGFRHMGELHLFLESERDSEPDAGRAVLVIGGEQRDAHEGKLWTLLRSGKELAMDHMAFSYHASVHDQLQVPAQATATKEEEKACAPALGGDGVA